MDVEHRTMEGLFRRALAGGARRTGISSAWWETAGSCENPQVVNFRSRPEAKSDWRWAEVPKDGITLHLDMTVACRRCQACLRHRARLWTARAQDEIRWAPGRTWFVTLTVAPVHRVRARAMAAARARQSGVAALDSLSPAERFRWISRVQNEWITRYLKRLRRVTEGGKPDIKFRYVLVAEPHKDGWPHYHMLLHEYVGTVLQKRFHAWEFGFWKAKLVEQGSRAPHYIAKYLAKAMDGRVRASLRYGAPEMSPVGQASLKATRENYTLQQERNLRDVYDVWKATWLAHGGASESCRERSAGTSEAIVPSDTASSE